MSYGQGLGLGTLTMLFGGLISSIYNYVYVSFIDPSVMEIIKDSAMEELENQGNDGVEAAVSIVEFMTNPLIITILGIVSTVFFGFVLSLIISIFTKNQKHEF